MRSPSTLSLDDLPRRRPAIRPKHRRSGGNPTDKTRPSLPLPLPSLFFNQSRKSQQVKDLASHSTRMLESLSNDDDPALLYSSRRKFLTSAGKSSLEPPLEFKTRRQARRQIQIQNSFDKEDSAPESVYLYLQKPTLPRKRESQFIFQSLLPSPKKFPTIQSLSVKNSLRI